MTSELVPGKETLIEWDGMEFPLPEQHAVALLPTAGEPKWVSLRTPLEGGLYEFRGLDEFIDRVVVHVGAEVARSGPPAVVAEGEPIPEPRGYPFPEAA
jgi:hypothetical protein